MNNYIKPVTRIVAVTTQQMVALGSVYLTVTGDSQNNTDALGKDTYLGWDDEDEENDVNTPYRFNLWED